VNEDIPELPEDLAAYRPIVRRLMAKDPAERFQSARELLEEVRALRQAGNAMNHAELGKSQH
jgi:hypothetical protein